MTEIKNIDPTRMNNGAHYTFMTNALVKAEANTTVTENAPLAVAKLKATTIAEDAALKISQKSLLTDDISTADRKRDTLYSAYRRLVKGSLDSPLDEQAEAAKTLWQNMKDYAIDTQAQLDKETGLITNLTGDLTGKYSAEVTALGLTAYVTALKDANDEVNTLIMQRSDERGAQVVGALRTARTATDAAYKELIKRINALLLLEPDDGYTEFVDYMNEEIDRYKQQVLSSSSSKKKASARSAATTSSETE